MYYKTNITIEDINNIYTNGYDNLIIHINDDFDREEFYLLLSYTYNLRYRIDYNIEKKYENEFEYLLLDLLISDYHLDDSEEYDVIHNHSSYDYITVLEYKSTIMYRGCKHIIIM